MFLQFVHHGTGFRVQDDRHIRRLPIHAPDREHRAVGTEVKKLISVIRLRVELDRRAIARCNLDAHLALER